MSHWHGPRARQNPRPSAPNGRRYNQHLQRIFDILYINDMVSDDLDEAAPCPWHASTARKRAAYLRSLLPSMMITRSSGSLAVSESIGSATAPLCRDLKGRFILVYRHAAVLALFNYAGPPTKALRLIHSASGSSKRMALIPAPATKAQVELITKCEDVFHKLSHPTSTRDLRYTGGRR